MALDLESAIKEPYTKKTSGIRVFKLIWGVTIVATWAYISLSTGALVPLPDSVVTITLGLFGIGAATRFVEKPANVSINTGP